MGRVVASGGTDFFQILNYALTRANNPDWDPDIDDPDDTHILRALSVGAAIINQYQTADLVDPKSGTRTTIIEYAKADDGTPLYAYGMANEDPLRRPPAAPAPPANYVFLNRRFENVGEFGYAYDLASTTASHTLNFQTSASKGRSSESKHPKRPGPRHNYYGSALARSRR